MSEYFSEFIDERADGGGDDLVTLAATADKLTHEEKIGFCILLLLAGNVTTTNLITNALWCFEEHDLIHPIRRGSISRTQALKEVLRYRSPVQSLQHVTMEPVELGGEEIEAGMFVTAWVGSANRDPAIFDVPTEFNPERRPNRHIPSGLVSTTVWVRHLPDSRGPLTGILPLWARFTTMPHRI